MEAREAYDIYSRAWNIKDEGERRRLLLRVWTDDAVYVDDEMPNGLLGADALLRYIGDSHAEMPGLVVTDASSPRTLRGRMLVRWVATEGDEQRYSGSDVVEFAADGRIARVTNFYDDLT